MTGTGRFDDVVVKFLAEHNELIVASGLEPGSAKHPNPACQEGKTRGRGGREPHAGVAQHCDRCVC